MAANLRRWCPILVGRPAPNVQHIAVDDNPPEAMSFRRCRTGITASKVLSILMVCGSDHALAAGNASAAITATDEANEVPTGSTSLGGAAGGRSAAEVSFGKALFEDKNLSADRSVACQSCHAPLTAFADPHVVSIGARGQHGTRNAPSLLDLSNYQSYSWDGRARTLEEQSTFPFLNPVELGFYDEGAVLKRVRANRDYMRQLSSLYGVTKTSLRLSDVVRPIVTYELTLKARPSALDQYLAGDRMALSDQARIGLEVFRERAGCAGCHVLNDSSAPLTDNDFHASALGLSRIGRDLGTIALALEKLEKAQRDRRITTDSKVAALGRFVVTLDPRDIGKFRTPSLRNVASTAPYMHDGSVARLEDTVDLELYYRGIERGYPVILSPEDKQALLVFLGSLSSGGPFSITRAQNSRVAPN